MNWEHIQGNWKKLRGQVLQQWDKLTDDELDAIDGRRKLLAGRIQELYGVSTAEAERQIEHFENTLAAGNGMARPDRSARDGARAPQR